MVNNKPRWIALPLLLLALISLLAGLSGGLFRAEVWSIGASWAGEHGGLMAGGFLGTLIAVERAVTLSRWALLVPLVNGSSLLWWAFSYPDGAVLSLLIGGVGLSILTWWPIRQQLTLYGVLIWLGAAWYTIGALQLYMTGWYVPVFPWWMAFFLFTIVGERLELSKFLSLPHWATLLLVGFLAVFLIGAILPYHSWGRLLMAMGCAGSGVWLMRFDMSRKSIRKAGVHRFVAGNLILGFSWLVATSLFLLGDLTGRGYDATLHAFFIGFVMAMVMAHAPIIFPGVFHIVLQPYHPVFWVWTFLLHATLLVRINGDYGNLSILRSWGSAGNVVAIVGYIFTVAMRLLVLNRKNAVKF